MNRLKGKYALITGASQGLGREIALTYAREAAAGLTLVARDSQALVALRKEINQVAPVTRVLVISADLASAEAMELVAATVFSDFGGRLDVLVNNASSIGPSPMPMLIDYPLPDFRRVLDTNPIGPLLLMKKVLPAMIEHGGSIINVTSDAGVVGYAGWGAYGVSKFALEGLSAIWAAELGDTAVSVNLVDPGDMNSAMHRAAEPTADPNDWADPSQLTEVFVYLASDRSAGISGRRSQAQEKGWGKGEEAPRVEIAQAR